jgi:ribosomal protein L40E
MIWVVAAVLLLAVAAYLVWPLVRVPRGAEDSMREAVPLGAPEEPEPDDEEEPAVQPGAAVPVHDEEMEKEIAELRRELKEVRFCSRCGARTGPGDSYCSRCGAPLKRGKR